MDFVLYRLTIDGHRGYPRTLQQAMRLIEIARKLRPEIRCTLFRVTQRLAP
jgi:hypothetical protein